MITDPDRYIDAFADAGAAMISVHVEVLPHLHRTVHAIKALGVKAGVVLNPATPVIALEEIAADVDFVLVMSVNPGFGGQTFIPRSESKVREVRAALDRAGNTSAPIEIDGGIDASNARRVSSRPAPESWSPGQAIFGTPDPEACNPRPQSRAAERARGRVTGTVTLRHATSRVRVRYAETDKMGVVYYANYLVWFEVGRTDLLRLSGWSYREMETDGFALPVVEAHCEYRQSARYDDELEIMTTGTIALARARTLRLSGRPRTRSGDAGRRAHRPRVARYDRQAATATRSGSSAVSGRHMNALVTGVAGFIGSTLSERLLGSAPTSSASTALPTTTRGRSRNEISRR